MPLGCTLIVACTADNTSTGADDTSNHIDDGLADVSEDQPDPDTSENTADNSETDANNNGDAGDTEGDTTAIPLLRGLDCLNDPICTHPLVAAHRGVHTDVPENSLASIRLGAEIGVDFVEIDVRHTADNVLVVVHDGTVDRTTTGSGEVSQMTWAELEALTLLGADENEETQRIPTFAQVLNYAVTYDVDLYIDLKTDRIAETVDAILQANALGHAWLRDDLSTMTLARELAPELALLVPCDSIEALNEALLAIPTGLSIEIPGGSNIPEDLVAAARAAGVRVQQDALGFADIFGLDGDNSAWQAMIDQGVEVLQTDFPELLLAMLGRGPSPE